MITWIILNTRQEPKLLLQDFMWISAIQIVYGVQKRMNF